MNFAKYSVKKNSSKTITTTSAIFYSGGGIVDEGETNNSDWFYKDADNNLHCKYNLVGDKEIAA